MRRACLQASSQANLHVIEGMRQQGGDNQVEKSTN